MKIRPESHIVLATNEEASLELDHGFAAVRLLLRFGSPVKIETEGGAFKVPAIPSPNVAEVFGLEERSGSEDASYLGTIEFASGHYFSLDRLREFGDERDVFNEYDDETLFWCRQAAEEVFEQNAYRSFVRRAGRTIDNGLDKLVHLRDNDVYRIHTEGYELVCDCYARRDQLTSDFPRVIDYEYGQSHVPAAVSSAVLSLAAYSLRPSNRPIGATGESTDAGYIHFTTAGRDGATSIPEVNAVIQQFGRGDDFLW